jgi:hypothetical protein
MSLSAGDRIELSVTHQIVINGDNSWVKLGVDSEVQKDETTDDAIERVTNLVNEKIIKAIEKTVETVNGYEGK